MNGFDSRLRQARARQHRIFLFIALGAAAVAAALAVFWIATQGISVVVSPQKADDRAGLRIKQGPGFTLGKKAYAFGEVVIEVRAAGFVTEEVAVAADKQSTFVEVVMREAPARLRVATVPEDAATRWLVDGALVATSQSLSMQMKPGTHTLVVNHPHYHKAGLEVFAEPGEEVREQIRLLPLEGRLQITTEPAGAAVSIDGAAQAAAPASYAVAGGRHVVEVSHPGYKNLRDTVEITNAETGIARNYRLAPQDAFVRFNLQPQGGRLLLNGRRTDGGGAVRVDSMRRHTASYSSAGYFPQSKTFTLQPGAEQEVRFSLREETGVVEILSRPPATVLIDGKEAGATPMTVSLRAVEHRITVAREGYRSVTQKLTPAASGAKRMDVTLKTELQARLAESPATYRNSVGMTLRLFARPGVVAMGAPRHEQGQRANEFQRTVRLTKAFYAALHETTAGQFGRYKAAPSAGKAGVPATGVTWLEAAAFCNWLSARERLRPFYVLQDNRYLGINDRADGYRLLTEAEWEWLARGAGRRQQTRFTWGDQSAVPAGAGNLADQSARGALKMYIPNYTDGFGELAPVGSFAAGKAGLYDLSGNVSEWVHDVYSLMPPAADGGVETDPTGPAGGGSHVFKGSNWRSATLTELRASFRETSVAGRDDLGFRVARYLYGGENDDKN